MKHRYAAILSLAICLMPIRYGMADDGSQQPRHSAVATAPLNLAQATDPNLCQRRCDFDHDTCNQDQRENCRMVNSQTGGYGCSRQTLQTLLDACVGAQRKCYRQCDRP
jgi:hypothetical protein